MSRASDEFEYEIASMVNDHMGERLPMNIPRWLENQGVVPGARIIRAEGIGSLDRRNKTDVVIYLENSEPIKISAKLMNADYFGNWYGHKRFLEEFGEDAFYRMTAASTRFANEQERPQLPMLELAFVLEEDPEEQDRILLKYLQQKIFLLLHVALEQAFQQQIACISKMSVQEIFQN